jgi:hypothetical protein
VIFNIYEKLEEASQEIDWLLYFFINAKSLADIG